MSQPDDAYPDAIRVAGPRAMALYDHLVAGLKAANGAAGPAELDPEQIRLIIEHTRITYIPPDTK